MDRGAHFFKCDFQVHTPRDINWIGDQSVTDDERKEYAIELIKACRERGVQAIAVTDHHDITFFKYIKETADRELDDCNNPIPTGKRIHVFPGMELTLGTPPCQVLLLLDCDFPPEFLVNLYTILAIEQSDPSEAKQAHIEKIESIESFDELYEELNKLSYLRGRFLVIPNVSEGGNCTILRSRFDAIYKRMPCVGGYLDGSYSQLGVGNLRILAGQDKNYGSKSLGIFQTSDSRRRDHAELGRHVTWVKWAVPTAEALRQACLAKESRISQQLPSMPAEYITAIDVSNSKFMGQVNVDFNQQYNALIGGRGTGKSTILEYLRWGLCDQPSSLKEDIELNYQSKRKSLIAKTLLPYNSVVQISFVKNNIPHIVRRYVNKNELHIKIGSGEFEECAEEHVRSLLPMQAYSQKQLSLVGIRTEELKRLLLSPILTTMRDYDSRFQHLRTEIRTAYEQLLTKKVAEKDIAKYELELKSQTEQINALKKALVGVTEDDKKIITEHNAYEECERIVEMWEREIDEARGVLVEMRNRIHALPTSYDLKDRIPDEILELLTPLQDEIMRLFKEINATFDNATGILDAKGTQLKQTIETIEAWRKRYVDHQKQYEAAKGRTKAHGSTLKQINIIESKLKELNRLVFEKKSVIKKLEKQKRKFEKLEEEWFELHKTKGDLLDVQCSELTKLSNGNLRVTLARGHGTTILEETLKSTIYGANVRKEKIEELCKRIQTAASSIHEWHLILAELEELANFNVTEQAEDRLKVTILKSLKFTANELRRISEKLNPNNWVELFLVELEDVPRFEYCTREDEFIAFEDASAGQQATALMHVLLNQDGPPLIIDQPEDDLDNKMVSDIVKIIWKAKMRRQLIFASHNANLVVNGDAELVLCCDYKITGDQSKGEIKGQGAIDVPEIKREITEVMEGGQAAFKLRRDKYGF